MRRTRQGLAAFAEGGNNLDWQPDCYSVVDSRNGDNLPAAQASLEQIAEELEAGVSAEGGPGMADKIKGEPAPLSRRFGRKLLEGDPAPLSRWLGCACWRSNAGRLSHPRRHRQRRSGSRRRRSRRLPPMNRRHWR
jgi:hypothetical protein